MRETLCGVVGVVMAAGIAAAAPVSPAVETFEGGLNGWAAPGTNVATAVTEDGNTFARTVRTVAPAGGGFPAFTVLGNTNAPGSPFVGDYLQGIGGGPVVVAFDVRHDSSVDLSFTLRLATAANSPAVILFNPTLVAAGAGFVSLEYVIDLSNPLLIPAGGDPATTLASIANIQLLADNPPVAPEGPVTMDFDNVRIVPAPGAGLAVAAMGVIASRRRRA